MRPTFKIVLFYRVNADGNRPVMLRATYLRESRYYPLHRYCKPSEWDKDSGRFRKSFKGHAVENDMLRTYEQRASDALRHFEREMQRFTFADFERMVFADRVNSGNIIWKWLLSVSASLLEDGKHGNSIFYKNVSAVIKHFAPGATLNEIDSEWLKRFERWQRKRGATDGGISINFRTLRSACNRAKKAKIMAKTWEPFEDFPLSHLEKTKSKRAIPLDDIWRLRDAECHTQAERFAIDLFLISFYTRGMNMADIAELRAGNIRDLRIVYERKKTHKAYSVRLHPKAAAILDRYKGGAYLFPIYADGVHVTDQQKFDRKAKVEKAVNKALRVIAGRVGLDVDGFTFYIARHSYATALKFRGVSKDVIQELLGHSDAKTTEHYLSGFEDSALDAADDGLF